MKKTNVFFLIILFCCIASGASAEILTAPLSKFANKENIALRCVNAGYTISVPLPERWKVKRASVSVAYASSSNLLVDKGQLILKVNNTLLGQTKLNPLAPEGKMTIEIPAKLLSPGYNKLGFYTALHYTKDCEHPCAPDLWVEMNLEDSVLEIEYAEVPVPLKLSNISDFIFDPKLYGKAEINFITDKFSSARLTVQTIAASGIARKFNYKPVFFTNSNGIRPGYDNILIGKKDYVTAFLKDKGIALREEIKGPFIKVAYLPSGTGENVPSYLLSEELLRQKGIEINEKLKNFLKAPSVSSNSSRPAHNMYRALLIVSGVTWHHVKMASEVLTNISIPYPGTDEMTITDFTLENITQYGGSRVLAAEKPYKFRMLDFPTHTFEGLQPVPESLIFRLPADFLVKANQSIKLNLNFSYGAGLRPDATLNIMLNGKQVKAINLDKPAGDTLTGYKLELPTYFFKPGENQLTFSPILTPIAKECDLLQPESFFLTVFENSSILFPVMAHFVEMPRLELLMVNGFPFTRWPDGYETLMYLTKTDNNSVAAALNLTGLITQRNGYPLFGLRATVKKPVKWHGELIVLGTMDTISDDYGSLAPLKLSKGMATVPYPVATSWEGETNHAVIRQKSELGSDNGIVMQFQSPHRKGRSVLMLAAATTKELEALSAALLDSTVQAATAGDLIVVSLNPPGYKVNAQKIGKVYFTGKEGGMSVLSFYLYTYPILYFVIIFLIIVIGTGIIYYLMLRYRQKKMKGVLDHTARQYIYFEAFRNRIKELREKEGGHKLTFAKSVLALTLRSILDFLIGLIVRKKKEPK